MNTRQSSITRLFRNAKLLVYRLIKLLSERMSQRNYQIIVSIVIGLVVGLMAVVLKISVHTVQEWLQDSDPSSERWVFVILPIVGISFTIIFVQFILRKPLTGGMGNLIQSIAKNKISVPRYEMYAHVVASSLTVGFGGSVGLEAPIVRTGSAIGANVAKELRADRKKQALFLACGAASGLAAVFNSPVGGVIFALEVLLSEFAVHSFIPLLISAAVSAVIAKALYYEQIFFLPTDGWTLQGIPFYVLLGALCGIFSAYMIRMVFAVKNVTKRYKHPLRKLAIGGLALGMLIFLLPPLFGEGYDTVNDLMTGRFFAMLDHSPFYQLAKNDWFVILFALFIILAKPIAAALTTGIGGNGGVFAPSMLMGALVGFVFVHTVNQLGVITLHEPNFIAVGMAGILSGVFKAPLTGIFLIAEITGGYELFVPLMIVSAISYFTSIYFEPYSIFTRDLYKKGIWVPAHEKDLNILKNMTVAPLVETDFHALQTDLTLGDFVKIIAKSHRNVFPVLNKENKLEGIILLDDVREIMFDTERYEQVKVSELMHNPPATVDLHEPMDQIMNKFESAQAWNLPVLNQAQYVGFVSKSSIFNRYRNLLIERSQEV